MKTLMTIVAIVGFLTLLGPGGVGVAIGQQPVPVDHYKCYVLQPPTQVKFANPLRVSDPNFDHEELIRKLISRLICNPVSKEGSQILQPDIHLKAYQIVPSNALTARPKVRLDSLNPHLPSETVEVLRPAFLLVPTLKCHIDPQTGQCP